MTETSRLLEAATAISSALAARNIPHAFHGTILAAIFARNSQCGEMVCIADGGNTHPFRRVREAVAGMEDLVVTNSPWTNRLFLKYCRSIPPIHVEILPSGEEGPRRLNQSTTMVVQDLPFLNISEYIRAKLRSWCSRCLECDAHDIIFMLSQFWQSVDINRIPEQDMERFVQQNTAAAPPWRAIKSRFGL